MSLRNVDITTHQRSQRAWLLCPTLTPFILGEGQIKIVTQAREIVAFGRVVSVCADGMGIAFTKIERCDQTVLERWMSDLRLN